MITRFQFTSFIMFALVMLPLNNAFAREEKGVSFPETIIIQETNCKLQGVGIRKKLIINVYLGALYLTHPTENADDIITSEQIKRITMHFLYKEVTAEQLIEAWNEGFENNAPDAINALNNKINTFNSFFTEPMKSGETIVITYYPGKGSEVLIKDQVKGVIDGHDFMEALFSIWFGPKPPSRGLKKGMLGE